MRKLLMLNTFVKVILGIICTLIIGCTSQHISEDARDFKKGMVYILPSNIVELLSEKIELEKKIYFVLDANPVEDEYTIYLINYTTSNNWIKNTNRYIDINGKLYPLIFGSDYTFTNNENAEEYLKNYNAGVFVRSKITPIFDNVYYVKFKSKRKIIE